MRAPRLLAVVVVVAVVAPGLAARGSSALGLVVGGGAEGMRIGPSLPSAPLLLQDDPTRRASSSSPAPAGSGQLDRGLLSPRSARLETGELWAASAASSSSSSASSPLAAATTTTTKQQQQPPPAIISPTVKHDVDDPYVQTVFATGSAPARRAEGGALVIPEHGSRERPADVLSAASTATPRPPNNDEDDDAPLDLSLARTLASLNTACYCRDLRAVARWRCGRCQSAAPDFRPSLVHFDASWDLLGLIGYWPGRRAIVLAFRGTDSGSLYNWAENMRAWRADARYPAPPPRPGDPSSSSPDDWPAPAGMRVHSGFLNLWNSSSMATTFSDAFAALLDANGGFVAAGNGGGGGGAGKNNGGAAAAAAGGIEAAYVVGHSMGGALAHLCALDLATRFGPEVGRRTHVYTFGAPRVGNAPFSEFSRRRVASYWRFTHARDVVPSVPPQLMGFHHAAREVWLVARDAWPGWGGSSAAGGEVLGGEEERQQERGKEGGVGGGGDRPAASGEEQRRQQRQSGRRRGVDVGLAAAAASPAAPAPPSSPPGRGVRWPSWPHWPWPPAPPPTPPPPPPPPDDPPLPPGTEERAVLCDPSGEDPSCHDSVCYLGLCTSVADHLLYLGRRFYHVDAECEAAPAAAIGRAEEEVEGEARIVVVAA